MVTTVVGYLAGYITGQVVVLTVLVAWLIALAATLAALLMTETPAGSPRGWRGLAAVVGAVFVEIPYQCLTLAYRMQTLLRPRKKIVWGEMGRSLGDSWRPRRARCGRQLAHGRGRQRATLGTGDWHSSSLELAKYLTRIYSRYLCGSSFSRF
jgi:hypothetical protein